MSPEHIIPSRRICRPPTRAGFTLVELLTVVAIIVAMVALAVPAFNGISKGSSLKAAGTTVSNMALLARQNSLSKNAMTAMVMIGTAGTDADQRAFSLYEITPHLDGTPVISANWKQITPWDILRDGVIADACTFTQSSVPTTPPLPLISYHGAPVANYQYIVFLPSGSLTTSTGAHVRLAPGYLPAGAQSVKYTVAMNGAGLPANYYDISILSASGLVKIDRP